jgi:excinuclease ABC subunit B
MASAIAETRRRRQIQERYNTQKGIMPASIRKQIKSGFDFAHLPSVAPKVQVAERTAPYESSDNLRATIGALEREMREAAKRLEFEQAAELRDRIKMLKEVALL